MNFETMYGEAIARTVEAYAASPREVLINALERLVQKAQNDVRDIVRSGMAQSVCEGLHEGPGSGLKCLSCYQAEQTFTAQMQLEAEIAAERAAAEAAKAAEKP